MIDCINEGVTVNRLILVVALLSLLVALTTWLGPFMQELLVGSARIIRMRYAVMAFRKNLCTDYTNIESLDGREKNKRAMEFYRSYYSSFLCVAYCFHRFTEPDLYSGFAALPLIFGFPFVIVADIFSTIIGINLLKAKKYILADISLALVLLTISLYVAFFIRTFTNT